MSEALALVCFTLFGSISPPLAYSFPFSHFNFVFLGPLWTFSPCFPVFAPRCRTNLLLWLPLNRVPQPSVSICLISHQHVSLTSLSPVLPTVCLSRLFVFHLWPVGASVAAHVRVCVVFESALITEDHLVSISGVMPQLPPILLHPMLHSEQYLLYVTENRHNCMFLWVYMYEQYANSRYKHHSICRSSIPLSRLLKIALHWLEMK